VYIYQDSRYIDECKAWGKFQEAKAEQTDEDIKKNWFNPRLEMIIFVKLFLIY